jgi:hypothetical protein
VVRLSRARLVELGALASCILSHRQPNRTSRERIYFFLGPGFRERPARQWVCRTAAANFFPTSSGCGRTTVPWAPRHVGVVIGLVGERAVEGGPVAGTGGRVCVGGVTEEFRF